MYETIQAVPSELEFRLEEHRKELIAHCYRMLGSTFDAEDAAQDTLLKAWRRIDSFEGRSTLRAWLYRIATNVCLDMLNGTQRRARPMDFGLADEPLGAPLPETSWVDPAEAAELHESVRLAFIAALQHLPPKQRSILILKDVLRWRSDEVAELLHTSVQSVNSALQRARATLGGRDLRATEAHDPMDAKQRALLARYVDAFERYDMDSLTTLLHEEKEDLAA